MDHTVYVVSDLHLGPGKLPGSDDWHPLEDFTSDAEFARFLDHIGGGSEPVELVIAGDFLECPQTLPEIGLASPEDHLGSTQAESLLRAEVIMGLHPDRSSGHPEVFKALRRFMMNSNSITLIAGNHDIDILWGDVWALLFDTIYPPGSWGDLRLREYSYLVGEGSQNQVYIEHGHEYDRLNCFGDQMTRPFERDRTGELRLKRCWGTLFVDKVYNELELERWFIDNVKPIMKVVTLGLRNDFLFTATALGLVARFLLTGGLPPLGDSGVLGGSMEAQATTDEIVSSLADDELRRHLQARMADPAFRAELDATLQGVSVPDTGGVLGGAPQPTLDEVSGDIMVLGGMGAEDDYRSAARRIMEEDAAVAAVIMGHTHGPIDGRQSPIDLADGRTGYYFNSGTWTRRLKDVGRSYSWEEIGDEDNYTATFTYIKLEPDSAQGYRPTMENWDG